ncbi:hypothetical protein [Novosphingobium sp. B1]|uniref:hypothetical protein n=1 Tax=Novosphingobium sp. B1 TaxID=1938756 RepID=UPI0009D8A7B2|nr:hypothetical protein [Novosphingobium sp. B1]SMC47988.1 hypothetical protein SAMN06272759_103166 [Novosphingobium sp. B1]
MNLRTMCGALALGLVVAPGVALADDPYDPQMRTQAARERDRAIIRKLNQQELARVRERDARYAEGWAQWRSGGRDERADDYAQAQREYEDRMAQWRRAVAACRAGHYEYCAR